MCAFSRVVMVMVIGWQLGETYWLHQLNDSAENRMLLCSYYTLGVYMYTHCTLRTQAHPTEYNSQGKYPSTCACAVHEIISSWGYHQ